MKKIVSLVIVLSILFTVSSIKIGAVEQRTSTDMDAIDIITALIRTLHSAPNEDGDTMWSGTTDISQFVPLYDIDDNIIAYYIEFLPQGYATVNNNVKNPILLELSEENCSEYQGIIGTKSNKVYYHGFMNMSISSTDEQLYVQRDLTSKSAQICNELTDFYSFCRSANSNELLDHNEFKNILGTNLSRNSDSDDLTIDEIRELYEIMTLDQYYTWRPSSNVLLPNAEEAEYGTSGEFGQVDGAVNRCGTVAAFNVVMYYREYYNDNTFLYNNRTSTFTALHQITGNGPMFFLKLPMLSNGTRRLCRTILFIAIL